MKPVEIPVLGRGTGYGALERTTKTLSVHGPLQQAGGGVCQESPATDWQSLKFCSGIVPA